MLRNAMDMSGINYADLKARMEEHFRKALADAQQERNASGPYTPTEKQQLRDSIDFRSMPNMEYWRLLGRDNAQAEISKVCEAIGVDIPKTPAQSQMLLDEIRRVQIAVSEAMLEHGESLERYDLSGPRRESVRPSAPPKPTLRQRTLSEAIHDFLTLHAKAEGWRPGTVQKRRVILDIAQEWFGADTIMSEIGKAEAADFKNRVLLNLPANRGKSEATRGLTLREALAVEDISKIDNATINSYLSACKNLWVWAEAHGYTDEVHFAGMNVGRKSTRSKQREPFSQAALETTHKALTEPQSKFYKKTSHRWATLIAMFSGARLNEVCQLAMEDIKQVEGLWIFDFTDNGDTHKRLKTSAAQRRVPVHSQLLRLGLLELIETRQSQGHSRLFQDFKYTEKAGYGDQLSKWFNRTFTAGLNIKSEAHVFHGLRHTFATRLVQADVETERLQFIIGHERQGVTHQVYMKEGYTLQQTVDAVERFAVFTPPPTV